MRKSRHLKSRSKDVKSHPFRLCPIGEHWVRDHPRKVEPSPKNPSGFTEVAGHCRRNRSNKDQIYSDEVLEICNRHFGSVLTMNKFSPGPGRRHWNNFDAQISGWTKYWNDILSPQEPLDPHLVKSLIATESSFKVDAKPRGRSTARGLTQMTKQTVAVLKDEKGELKDHLVNLDLDDRFNPCIAIAAGIRWLFHKKEMASRRLKRESTWEEAIVEYKGYWRDIKAGKDVKGMRDLRKFYEELKS